MRRRVKITGLGPVTAAGIGRAAFERGINEPVSRIREVTLGGFSETKTIAGAIPNFRLSDWWNGEKAAKKLPRHTQFALAGTALALADAGISPSDLSGLEPAVINGSSLMDFDLTGRTVLAVAAKGGRYGIPTAVFEAPPSAVGGRIARSLGVQCRTLAIQTACCAGLDAIGHGAGLVAAGEVDLAVCCGTEAPIFPTPMAELTLAKLSPRNIQAPTEMGMPFDLWRNTGVIGEGACVVILEPETSPRPAYAWIGGYAFGGDDEGASANGLEKTIRMALANACASAAQVDLIHAWGPGHVELDREEARCLSAIFGPKIARVPAVSIKGSIGNPLAAAGPIQVASAALALKTGRIPPTVNWRTPDPECPLNLSGQPRDIGCSVALVNAHGLSGTNSSLVLFGP